MSNEEKKTPFDFFVQELERVCGHPFSPVKDPKNYNLRFFSKEDEPFCQLSQKAFNPGDICKIVEYSRIISTSQQALAEDTPENKETEKQAEKNYNDFLKAIKENDYRSYPFGSEIANEFRLRSLVATEKEDNFINLFSELDVLIHQVMSHEEWKVLKDALLKSRERLKKTNLLFLNPMEPINPEKVRGLTEEEVKTYFPTHSNPQEIKVEDRTDDLCLVALKNLLLMLKGEVEVNPYNFGLSFFQKAIPELKKYKAPDWKEVSKDFNNIVLQNRDSGYSGYVIRVSKVTKKIVEIKLAKVISNPRVFFAYSPTRSASLLKESYPNLEELWGENEFYMATYGLVAICSNMRGFNHDGKHNDETIKATELFHFQKNDQQEPVIWKEFVNRDKNNVQTRISFIPLEYSKLSLINHNGFPLVGDNDESYQSVFEQRQLCGEDYIDMYKDYYRDFDGFEEAVLSAQARGGFIKDPDTHIFKKENYGVLKDAMHSVSGICGFPFELEVGAVGAFMGYPIDMSLICNYAPLNRRFLFAKYLSDGKGITQELQPTFWLDLLATVKLNRALDFFGEMDRIKRASTIAKKDKVDFDLVYKRLKAS